MFNVGAQAHVIATAQTWLADQDIWILAKMERLADVGMDAGTRTSYGVSKRRYDAGQLTWVGEHDLEEIHAD